MRATMDMPSSRTAAATRSIVSPGPWLLAAMINPSGIMAACDQTGPRSCERAERARLGGCPALQAAVIMRRRVGDHCQQPKHLSPRLRFCRGTFARHEHCMRTLRRAIGNLPECV